MHIGLIGGIGPSATIAYYNRLLGAFKLAEFPLELTIVHANVERLIANAGSDQREAQAEIFVGHLNSLKGAGCDIAAITALTGHFCFDETRELSPLPPISAIDPIDRFCAKQGYTTIGLLGGTSVLATHLFGGLRNTKTVIPMSGPTDIGEAYLEIATTGNCREETRQKLFSAGLQMTREQGASAVLLAGTDLGLAFDGYDPGFKTIDAMAIHVEALVSLYAEAEGVIQEE